MRKRLLISVFILTLTALCGCEKHEHNFTPETIIPAACTETGTILYTCSCGESKEETEESLGGHTWESPVIEKEPGCTGTGLNSIACSVCGEITYEDTPALGHSWDAGTSITEPNCITEGSVLYNCTVCRETNTETVTATGVHTWDEGDEIRQSTCKDPGEILYTCRICSETKTEEIPLLKEHTWDEGVVIKYSNCIELGDKVYTCTVCSVTKDVKIGYTETHTWDSGKILTSAGCATEGSAEYTCTVCSITKTEAIAATGKHTWDTGSVTLQETCGTNGKKAFTCTVCGAVKEETVPATGAHTWDEGKITKSPTVLAEGSQTFTCNVCKTAYSVSVPKLVDTKTTVYTTESKLYIGGVAVYGVVKMNGYYYIPVEVLDDRNVLPSSMVGWNDYEDYYQLSINPQNIREDALYYVERKNFVSADQVLGTGQIENKILKYQKTDIQNAVCTLNGDFPMVRLDLIGAEQKGDDFYLDLTIEKPKTAEKDLVGEIIPSLRRTTTKETVIAIHDYLVNTLTYDPRVSYPYWATEDLLLSVDSIMASAAKTYTLENNLTLAGKYGVCQNYAELFREICNRMGIPCVYVSGVGNGGSHGWNKVYLDGQWLYVDCTFDDPVSQEPAYRNEFCLVGPEKMAIQHAWRGDDYPMPDEYDPAWEKLDSNNITSADMFRKCLVAQMMQKKTSFSLRTTAYGAYGGSSCIFKYDTGFYEFSYYYNSSTGTYDFTVSYW